MRIITYQVSYANQYTTGSKGEVKSLLVCPPSGAVKTDTYFLFLSLLILFADARPPPRSYFYTRIKQS